MTNSSPLVSVVMITYGHEAFIREAIEGVLMQQTDFAIELIVANDCSPDSTDDIAQEILRDDPRSPLINYTRHEKNLGMIPNFLWALNQANGKYIAICEGDDYWTDRFKLQKQVNILENDVRCALCTTNVLSINEQGLYISEMHSFNESFYFNLNDVLSQLVSTNAPSLIFRSELLDLQLLVDLNPPLGDEMVISSLLCKGNGFYLNELTANYRIHENGAHSMKPIIVQAYNKTKTLDLIRKHLPLSTEIKNQLKASIKEKTYRLFIYAIDEKSTKKQFQYLSLIIRYNPKVLFDPRLYYNWFIKKIKW